MAFKHKAQRRYCHRSTSHPSRPRCSAATASWCAHGMSQNMKEMGDMVVPINASAFSAEQAPIIVDIIESFPVRRLDWRLLDARIQSSPTFIVSCDRWAAAFAFEFHASV